MTPGEWIALAALILTILAGCVYLGRVIGALPGLIVAAVREHERGCSNHDPNTGTNLRALPPAP